MKWLLDTCVISELPRLAPNKQLLIWLQNHAKDAALSAVTFGEIQYGIQRLDIGRNRNRLQTWFDGICTQFVNRTLHADEVVWLTWGRLKSEAEQLGRPQEDFDLLIAATAQVHGLTLVTRNVKHFKDTGIELFNPWAQ
jgi:toxin FitB